MRRSTGPTVVFLCVAAVLAVTGAVGLTLSVLPAGSSSWPWIVASLIVAAWTIGLVAAIATRRAVRAALSHRRARAGAARIAAGVAVLLAVVLVLGAWWLRRSLGVADWSGAEREWAAASGTTLVVGLLLGTGVLRRGWLLLPEGRMCGACGHLLADSQERCPECGHE